MIQTNTPKTFLRQFVNILYLLKDCSAKFSFKLGMVFRTFFNVGLREPERRLRLVTNLSMVSTCLVISNLLLYNKIKTKSNTYKKIM